MIDINQVKEGDVIVWTGKSGEIRGKVKRLDNGILLAMTDETHGIPVSHLCQGNNRLIPGKHNNGTTPTQQTQCYDNDVSVPLLF